MRPKKLAAALLALPLLSNPVSADVPATEQGTMDDAHGPTGEAEPSVAGFEGTLIERTLGETPSETIVVDQGAVVRLVLHAPEGTELHLHGYDVGGVAGHATPVVFTFRAHQLGRFPIEAHGLEDMLGRKHKALAFIEVRPE